MGSKNKIQKSINTSSINLSKMKWINIKDEKPEVGIIVLVTDGDTVEAGCRTLNDLYPFKFIQDDTSVEHIDDVGWFSVNAYIKDAITHWMPLPEPPNEA